MWYFVLIVILVLVQIYLAPYTKVEESFNIQAIHDLLQHGINISAYDHLEFPGVVPRTFIGPIIVAIISAPAHYVFTRCDLPLVFSLYLSRSVLAGINLTALFLVIRQVRTNFGNSVAKITCFITLSQFHFLFYISRPLPNTFAMSSVLFAIYFLLKNEVGSFIWTSAFAILIFRSELVVFLGLFLLTELLCRNTSVEIVFAHGVCALLIWVVLSLGIDSYFWQQLVWPEGVVFYFNVILNKSSAWGVLPFHAYFTSLLPKAIGPLVPILIPIAVVFDSRFIKLSVPCLGFILIYSILPHKELRFVMYAIPVLNIVAARGWAYFSNNWGKSFVYKLVCLILSGLFLMTFTGSNIMLMCSVDNYPGGVALEKFHRYVSPTAEVNLHMDNLVCQTGAVRFGQLNPNWVYNKTEHLKPGSVDTLKFSHLLVDMSTDYQVYKSTHTVLFTVRGYSRLILSSDWPFLEVVTVPKIVALQHKNYESRIGKFADALDRK